MIDDNPNDQRVDDLRRQLRALGYLDGGVDRFVLGPVRRARPPAAIAALASIRVGAIAAALLGPAAALGIGARLPGLVTGPRDAIVVALYLGAIFGLALTVFTFVVSTIVPRFAGGAGTLPAFAEAASGKRARMTSRAAGGVVAVVCLTYLTLWWRSANAGFAWASPIWTALALAVAVTISFLLGHAVAITTFAVMAARRHESVDPTQVGRDATDGEGTRSSWRLVVAAGVLAFCGAAALLLLTAPAAGRSVDRPPLAVVSPGLRVKLIAIDGFDPDVFETLRSAGRVPALARLMANGVARFPADETRDPARGWTTVATGQPPEAHGVHGLETRRIAGLQGAVATGDERGVRRAIRGTTDLLRLTRPSVASGGELRTKPIWEVAADAGLRAAVVNWWATWPAGGAGAHAPLVISDRATLRLQRGGSLDAEIAPEELYESLRAQWPAVKNDAAHVVATSLPTTTDPEANAALRRSAELDALQLGLASRVSGDSLDLLALYLPGLDVAQHTLLAPVAGAAPSAISARLDALRGYYVYLDALLKDLASPAKDELVILVTQPGRLSSTAQGIVAVHGAIAAPGVESAARAVDVAPTVLHALGVPVSRELAGAPIAGLFSPAFLSRFPVRDVPTYGPRNAQVTLRRGDPLDQEAIERLRSLGYVR